MKNYLTALITEKGQDLENSVSGEAGQSGMTYEILIDCLMTMPAIELKKVRSTLVQIDFQNGDVFHFLTYLADFFHSESEANFQG